ncbi:AAA family ATPase [Soehngenia saccharolytica]|nr:AAA family ATPase [Soehngenia saccharolytica]
MYDISNISQIVQKYAQITASIAGVDVEVVNYKLIRVAGTGIFNELLNEDVSENSHIYKNAILTGERQIVYEPGKDERCKNCKEKDICQEKFEISMPIKLNEDILGVIGMACPTEEAKEYIVKNLDNYLLFLEQIADFISTRAYEEQESLFRSAMYDTLKTVIKNMDEGAIIIDNGGLVDTINPSAKKQLGITRIINKEKIGIIPTGDTVENSLEYRVKIGENENKVIGDIIDIPNNPMYKQVMLFRDINKVHTNIYEMTSTINVMGADRIIGSSPQTKALKEEIKKVSNSISTVLITGESGSGKEVVATAIWQNSDRRNNRFVAINCAAIPEPLLESELFGYVKGAFTGADPRGKIGKFELANNGVIFLDEIGDMPIYLQSKILRVIQDKKVTRIGSNQVIPLDLRIIAATNKDLRKMINENKFREDLYYRLNVIPIHIVPLRERKEDILDLLYYFIDYYRKLFGKKFVKIEEYTVQKLLDYPWYGNVRELENTVEFMVNMMEDGVINNSSLPLNIRNNNEINISKDLIRPLKEIELEEIKKAIDYFGDTTDGKMKAAKALGIGIATLYRKLNE